MSKSASPLFVLSILACAAAAFAQEAVQAVDAERSVPFGVAVGQLVQTGDQLLFVDQDDPAKTFAISRSNVADTRMVDGVLTVQTREAVVGSTTHTFRVSDVMSIDVDGWARSGPSPAMTATSESRPEDVDSFRLELDVEEERSFAGDETGKLLITHDEVRYTSVTDAERSFTWEYQDIKEFIRKNQNKVKIKAFTGKDYTFTLVGEGITSGQYREIVDRLAKARRGG